jgi:excisionase family DNA binding protein
MAKERPKKKRPKFITVGQICEVYGVTRGQVLKWIERGQVRAVRLGENGFWSIRLGDEARKRANQEVFGQEALPKKGSDAYKAGAGKIDQIRRVVRVTRDDKSATASPAPERDAAYRLVMESEHLDRDTKDLFKGMYDRDILPGLEGIICRLGKDPNKQMTVTKDGKPETVPAHELLEDVIVLKAVVNKDKLTEDEKKAVERKIRGLREKQK